MSQANVVATSSSSATLSFISNEVTLTLNTSGRITTSATVFPAGCKPIAFLYRIQATIVGVASIIAQTPSQDFEFGTNVDKFTVGQNWVSSERIAGIAVVPEDTGIQLTCDAIPSAGQIKICGWYVMLGPLTS